MIKRTLKLQNPGTFNKQFDSVRRSRVKSPVEKEGYRDNYGSRKSRGGTADKHSRHSSKASLNALMQERPDIGLFG